MEYCQAQVESIINDKENRIDLVIPIHGGVSMSIYGKLESTNSNDVFHVTNGFTAFLFSTKDIERIEQNFPQIEPHRYVIRLKGHD